MAMLSVSLQAEADRKKEVEEELQQSREEVRSYAVTFGSKKCRFFLFFHGFFYQLYY